MKKIIILIHLFTSIVSIGQNKEYKKAVNLFNGKQYAEANVIVEKLLNKEFGDLDEEKEFYCLQMNTNCYSLLNDFPSAYSKAKIYLDFIKNSSKGFLVNKETAIEGAEKLIEELKLKIPKEDNGNSASMIASESSSATKTDNSESKVAEPPKPVSDDKTVTLTVSGTGKTLEEAKLNALRSAIEQAFGAFISSKTEILNDNLIKDEIVSVASGNVQKFDIVSQVEVPNVGYAMTLNATVSIDKLTSFAESKGVVVEFKGGLFAANIKLQELNEKAEYKAIGNLLLVSLDLLQKSYDYDLAVSEPKFDSRYNAYELKFNISTKKNANYDAFIKYFVSTIDKVAVTKFEASEREKTGKKEYHFIIDGKLYQLRSPYSMIYLFNFFLAGSLITTNSFGIYTNDGRIIKLEWCKESVFRAISKDANWDNKIITRLENVEINVNDSYSDNFEHSYSDIVDLQNKNDYFNALNFLTSHWRASEYNRTSPTDKLFFMTTFKSPEFSFTKHYNLSDIENISSFSIKKIEFFEFLKNRDLYVEKSLPDEYSCFLKNTKISIPSGYKNIQDIKIGDEVICFDDKGNLHTSIVESINSHQNQDVFKYSVWNGEPLFATPNHWVLTSENSFTEIGKLNELLTLVDTDGGLKPITKVEYFGKETVYNFIVKDYHTYIANDIRVHNGGKGKFKASKNGKN
ncbi:MAG TPA: hypothetical protein DCM02_04480 [Flavobacterium sp.]|nr:hypothetical protein [Flavobacterium sp.]